MLLTETVELDPGAYLMDLILVADADPLPAVLEQKIGSEDLQLLHASDSAAARRILSEKGPDVRVLLLDWRLPQKGGLPLLKWTRQQRELPYLEVVVESSQLGPEDVRHCINCGACRFVSKPWQPYQLLAALHSAVTDSRLKESLLGRIREYEDALSLLTAGVFKVHTLKDAESLAIGLGRLCRNRQDSMGILELLSNAIEHGNLRIGYEEKSQLLKKGIYRQEIERRLSLPEHREKNVTVHVKISEQGGDILIEDEGPGFDFQSYMEIDQERLFDSHGRGILMANSLLDLQYEAPGNKVRVHLPPRENEEAGSD
ncbi:MAG TPA: response regulator [Acidobacteriota bacterium]|nr:response regulator [Acidobacteriota bacterium]